jgi:hypothetical protein
MVDRAEYEAQQHLEELWNIPEMSLKGFQWQPWWRNTAERKSLESEIHRINGWPMKKSVPLTRMPHRCGLPGVGVPFWGTITIKWWMGARLGLS